MPDHHEQLAILITRYLRQELTAEEQAALNAWLAEQPANRAFLEGLDDERHLQRKLRVFDEVDRDRLWTLTQSKFAGEAGLTPMSKEMLASPSKIRTLKRGLPYVAAVLIGIATVTWYFFDDQSNEGSDIVSLQEPDIAPGGNRATLTLADGRTITLDEARDGVVIGNGAITYNDGKPLAEADGSIASQAVIPLLELRTPKGGTYQITLSDGTKVWLNAASSLRYPARFDGDERVIELEGEAYFDVVQVSKDVDSPRQPAGSSQNVPFKVVTSNQTIEVLGTEFNISAYADDRETKTTLVAGKVRVKAIVPGVSNPLSPVSYLESGQQAITRGSELEVTEVDIFDYTAWRDGIIVLNGARLADVMRQVERWYDVTIEFSALKTNKTAYVIIDRNENLSSVLKALEETYQVKLKLAGRRVGIIE